MRHVMRTSFIPTNSLLLDEIVIPQLLSYWRSLRGTKQMLLILRLFGMRLWRIWGKKTTSLACECFSYACFALVRWYTYFVSHRWVDHYSFINLAGKWSCFWCQKILKVFHWFSGPSSYWQARWCWLPFSFHSSRIVWNHCWVCLSCFNPLLSFLV